MNETEEAPRWRRRAKALLRGLGLFVGIPLLLLSLFIVLFEDAFIYFPSKYPEGDWETGPSTEDVEITTSDGVRIHGWFVRGTGARWTILYFHGNAGNLSHRRELVHQLARLPADVLIIDYRGYGKSEGSPSEDGLYADARAGYDFLTKERGVSPERLVLFGHSLGAAIAIELASTAPCGRLIVQSSFTNIKEMSSRVIPLLPIQFMLRHRYDNLAKVPTLTVPKLHIHGQRDEVIPYDHGRRLFEAAAEPKEFFDVPEAGHNDVMTAGGRSYDARLRAFLNIPPSPAP